MDSCYPLHIYDLTRFSTDLVDFDITETSMGLET